MFITGDPTGFFCGGFSAAGNHDTILIQIANTPANPSNTKAAMCNACGGGKIVKTVDGVTSCVEEADYNNGYFVDSRNGKKCSKCASSCKTCENTETQCTSCTGATLYLKKEDGSETGTCVNQGDCPATHYIDEAAKTCTTCTSGGAKDCKTCEKNGDGAVCKECPDSDKTIFGLNKKSCVASCPANSSNQGGACTYSEGFQPSADSTECQSTSNCITPGCKTCNNEGKENEAYTECNGGTTSLQQISAYPTARPSADTMEILTGSVRHAALSALSALGQPTISVVLVLLARH
eukprot:XP_001704632.1 VSP [Giardia lamblia ATCC 50803]